MKRTSLHLSAIAATLILAACGGGSGTSASTALLGTSTSSGTVTGFGSIIVDGVRIDDSAVVAGVEQEDGSVMNAELKIGQHVDVEHDANLKAAKIRISSELKGPVDTVDTVAGTLSVLGQTVVINVDPNMGPVTVFEVPYTQLSSITKGETIEVHGLIKVDAAGKVTLQATRIEKETAGTYNRVKGHVADLTASTFKVGGLLVSYAGATVKPSGAVLAIGTEVYVSIPVNPAFTGAAINAAVIKVRDRRNESHDMDAKLGGAITKLDAVAKSFIVDGVKVDASQARFEQAGKGYVDLNEGVYVRVKGTYLADGALKATTIILRSFEHASDGEIELHGSILNFSSKSDFKLRGLGIDASTATITCPDASPLANDLQVEVEGRLTPAGKVLATKVKCEIAQEGHSIIEREGIANHVDVASKTLMLGSLPNTLSVQWNATTLFVGVVNADPSGLAGKKVEIEGTLSGNVFLATKIKLETTAS